MYFLCISEKKILTTKFTENITRVLLHEYVDCPKKVNASRSNIFIEPTPCARPLMRGAQVGYAPETCIVMMLNFFFLPCSSKINFPTKLSFVLSKNNQKGWKTCLLIWCSIYLFKKKIKNIFHRSYLFAWSVKIVF